MFLPDDKDPWAYDPNASSDPYIFNPNEDKVPYNHNHGLDPLNPLELPKDSMTPSPAKKKYNLPENTDNSSILPIEVFNPNDDLDKVHKSVFLPAPAGALNTIVISHPYLWKLYKRLRSLDWDMNEFDHARSKIEFMTANANDVNKLIMTILWQWETDSTASRVITDIVSAFWPGTELSSLAQRIAENESLHSHSYSEIVKNCLENYSDVIEKLKTELEPLRRLGNVARLFKECLDVANRFRLDPKSVAEDEVRRAKLLFFGGMICMERIQFMSSFAVTFAYGDRGSWNSIAKTVQKIAVDELSVHVRTWKYCFKNESRLPEYATVLPGVMRQLHSVVGEVLSAELANCDFIFKDGENITHKSKAPVTVNDVKQYVRYSAQNVMDFFEFELPFARIEVNPLPYMDKWTDINSVQTSPQEELTGNYLLGGFINDLTPGEAYVPSFLR